MTPDADENEEPVAGEAARKPAGLAARKAGDRWAWTVYGVGLAIILTMAAFQRLRLPPTPLVDDDVWGYLHPAFSALHGGPFQHAQGRNFLYPAFLWAVLKLSGDYRAISECQHLAGLCTGGLLAAAWNVLGALLPGGRRARWWARFLGWLLVADFSWSQAPVLFEHTVRPEGVFPFFLALSLLLNSGALHAGFVRPRPRLERWCLGTNFLVTAALQALKPSFGSGVIAANLPLLYWLTRRGVPWRTKLTTTGGAAAAAGLLLALPEHLLKRGDPAATTFLPSTLLTIHAAPIHEQIAADLRAGRTGPFEAKWLRDFDDNLASTLATSARPENGPWHTLGINADYLMYKEPVFRGFFPREQPQRRADFCFYYYKRTWEQRPGEMLAKIGRQLASVYPRRFETALGQGLQIDRRRKHWVRWFFHAQVPAMFAPRLGVSMASEYRRSLASCQAGKFYDKLADAPDSRRYLQALAALQTTDRLAGEPGWVCCLNDLLSKARLPLVLCSVAAGAVAIGRQGRRGGPLVAGAGLGFATNFAMFLTVAIVHSLDVQRYVDTQLLLTQWSGFAAALLLAHAALALTERRRPKRTGEMERDDGPADGGAGGTMAPGGRHPCRNSFPPASSF